MDLANGYIYIVIKFQWSFNPMCGVQYKFIFSPKIVHPFPPFLGGVEKTYSQFTRKLFNQLENWLRIMKFYKKHAVWMEVTTQLRLHVPGGKCVTWNNISPTPFNRFSSSFHQIYNHASGHLILTKLLIFDCEYFFKKNPNVKSRWRSKISKSFWIWIHFCQ